MTLLYQLITRYKPAKSPAMKQDIYLRQNRYQNAGELLTGRHAHGIPLFGGTKPTPGQPGAAETASHLWLLLAHRKHRVPEPEELLASCSRAAREPTYLADHGSGANGPCPGDGRRRGTTCCPCLARPRCPLAETVPHHQRRYRNIYQVMVVRRYATLRKPDNWCSNPVGEDGKETDHRLPQESLPLM